MNINVNVYILTVNAKVNKLQPADTSADVFTRKDNEMHSNLIYTSIFRFTSCEVFTSIIHCFV